MDSNALPVYCSHRGYVTYTPKFNLLETTGATFHSIRWQSILSLQPSADSSNRLCKSLRHANNI